MAIGEIHSYSPDLVKIVIGSVPITGYADGTFIDIEPVSDGVTSESGADGEVARAIVLDMRHTLTLTLQQSSMSNNTLSAIADRDRDTGGNGTVPISVVDLRGGTLFAGTGWIKKKAKATYSKGLESREWAIEAVGRFDNAGQV